MFLNKEYENRILNQTTTPPSTPPRKGMQSPGGDRFIPSRKGNNWETRFATFTDTPNANTSALEKTSCENAESRRDGTVYKCVLKNELLGANINTLRDQYNDQISSSPQQDGQNMFEFMPPAQVPTSPYTLSPLSVKSQQLLRSPLKRTQNISAFPFKVLDAPELEDDFYLNLVDWSSENVLAVGLASSVYLWSASSSDVTRLCNLASERNLVTSVAWNDKGNLVAVGTNNGYVQIYDVAVNKQVNKLVGHSERVGALAWNGDVLASGSRDKDIFLRDVRTPCLVPEKRLVGHRQEVCGLKWSPDKLYLASGGNDNRLNVWNLNSLSPVQTYTQHVAAVKAIAWSPHQHGLLASGGGTADCHICFWNTLTGQPKQSINTGSQVCNLVWSKHTQEFVSTHGYSQNEIVVWKYPSLVQVAKLTGHSCRVLYLAMAPNGEAIVTGAGEGVLKFWNVFRKAGSQKENKSVLKLFSSIR